MIVPEEFNRLCLIFHQDAHLIDPTPQALAASAAGSLDTEERKKVHRFLDKLLDGSHTRGDMRSVWRRSPAQFYFRKGAELEAFLRMVRDALR